MDVNVIKEILDSIVSQVKDAVKGMGSLLRIFDFSISDGSPDLIHTMDGGFDIRIKMTDDMKGYDSYTLYYVDDEIILQKLLN